MCVRVDEAGEEESCAVGSVGRYDFVCFGGPIVLGCDGGGRSGRVYVGFDKGNYAVRVDPNGGLVMIGKRRWRGTVNESADVYRPLRRLCF